MKRVLAIARMVVHEIFRKKDFYVALVLTLLILLYAASLRFYQASNVVRYLTEIGLMLVFVFSTVLTVALAARQFPSEMQGRTLQVLLAKPVSRAEFILGKFLGSFMAGAACFSIFFLLFLAIVAWKGSLSDPATAVQTYGLFLLGLMVTTALASGLSYYLTVSANVTIALAVYFLIDLYGPGLRTAASTLVGPARWTLDAVYFLAPHFEFFDLRQRFIHVWGPVSPRLVIFLAAYAVVYSTLFLFLGWAGFRRRTL